MANNYVSESNLKELVEQMNEHYLHTALLEKYILNCVFPVGSIYTTTNSNQNPQTFLGGTWEFCGRTMDLTGDNLMLEDNFDNIILYHFIRTE